VINSSDNKPKPFEHLSIIKSNYFTILFTNKNKNSNDIKENNVKNKTEVNNAKNIIEENMKNNKLDDIDKNAKNTVIKIIEKKPDKFTNLSISNKIVDICIIKKATSTANKKTKKTVNKFRNLVYVNKVVHLCLKSKPKPAPKPIKPKANNTNKKFLSKVLKISSINNFKIESTKNGKINKKNEKKKEIVLNKTKTEFFSIEKCIKKMNDIESSKLVEIKDGGVDGVKKSEVLDGKNQSKSKHIDLIVNKNESFTFNGKPKIKSVENKLYEITKQESIYYSNSNSNSNSVKKELIDNKNVENNNTDNKIKNNNNKFNIEKNCSFELILKVNKKKVEEKNKIKKEEKKKEKKVEEKKEKEKEKNKEKIQLQISNISPINFEEKKKSF
jgi:hypothetical protein